MPGCHILIERLYGFRAGHLSVLLVHVVSARTGIISNPDAEVLDLHGPLLVNLSASPSVLIHVRIIHWVMTPLAAYLIKGDDLAVCLFHFPQLH